MLPFRPSPKQYEEETSLADGQIDTSLMDESTNVVEQQSTARAGSPAAARLQYARLAPSMMSIEATSMPADQQIEVVPPVVAEMARKLTGADSEVDKFEESQDDKLLLLPQSVIPQYGQPFDIPFGGASRLSTLSAYLSALSLAQQRENLSQLSKVLPLAHTVAILSPQQQVSALRQRMATYENHDWAWTSGHTSLLHIMAFLVAFAGTLLLIKLILRKYERKMFLSRSHSRRQRHDSTGGEEGDSCEFDADTPTSFGGYGKAFRSFWTSASSVSRSGTIAGAASKQVEAEAGNPVLCRQSTDSGHGTLATAGSEDRRKNFELLSQKLLALLNYRKFKPSKEKNGILNDGEDDDDDDDDVIDAQAELLASDVQCAAEEAAMYGGYRTSTSYIKSLIEVLSKARTQVFSAKTGDLGVLDDDRDVEASVALASKESGEPILPEGADDASKVVADSNELITSQMDISAAHLILNYMEKHLDDKERLRREWQELNAGKQGGGSKANQLVLQRLAKVALREENRAKNRSQHVVPFDRNRVRLGCATSQAAGIKRQNGCDYINASYIYDDDPRRPTHIIAQGPSEQSCGQFWQMIWEQDVSVIVMLTRLNENSAKMCHCYWPTNVATTTSAPGSHQTQSSNCNDNPAASSPATQEPTTQANGASPVGGGSAGGKQSKAESSLSTISGGGTGGSSSPAASNGARRGSVTSVFNTVGPGACARHNHSTGVQPIIANGDLRDNVLIFEAIIESDEDSTKTKIGKSKGKPTASIVQFEVQLVSEHVSSSDYLVRNMYLTNKTTGESRTITQFHYLAWPENGVPENVRSFLQFRRKVHKSYRDLRTPILVHCSDGAGRSGTYCLIDIILERIRNGAKEIDPRATLEHLRDQRTGLCATLGQFEFVLVSLAEEIQIILNALPR